MEWRGIFIKKEFDKSLKIYYSITDMENETPNTADFTPETKKRGRKGGTPDTIKVPITKLLELGGERLIVSVNRKWLESLVELYSTEGVEALEIAVNEEAASFEPPAPLEFRVEEEL